MPPAAALRVHNPATGEVLTGRRCDAGDALRALDAAAAVQAEWRQRRRASAARSCARCSSG